MVAGVSRVSFKVESVLGYAVRRGLNARSRTNSASVRPLLSVVRAIWRRQRLYLAARRHLPHCGDVVSVIVKGCRMPARERGVGQ